MIEKFSRIPNLNRTYLIVRTNNKKWNLPPQNINMSMKFFWPLFTNSLTSSLIWNMNVGMLDISASTEHFTKIVDFFLFYYFPRLYYLKWLLHLLLKSSKIFSAFNNSFSGIYIRYKDWKGMHKNLRFLDTNEITSTPNQQEYDSSSKL